MVSNTSNDIPFQILNSEFEKLEQIIEFLPKNSEKTVSDIVTLYYQVIMVQTLVKKLSSISESKTNENQNFSKQIAKIEIYLTENFKNSLHPEILSQLAISIKKSTETLKLLGHNQVEKTKEKIEKEALLYKELRALMSTKEFVEQYETGIKDD